MEIKNVLFAEALDAWLLCYGGKEEDVEYVGEWNRLARVLCKLALDDEFVEYAREIRNVSIECVCTQGESGKYQNVDITALVQAGELLQTLTERRAKDPARILSMTLALGEDEE